MMNRLSLDGTAIDGQLGLYEQQADSWKTDHDRAMAFLDIDAITNFGLGIYKSIRHADQAWSEAIRSGAMVLERENAERLARWYRWWIRPCDLLLGQIRELESEGYPVDNAAEFREACLHVRSALSIPLDTALSKDGGGPGRAMEEIRDATSEAQRPIVR
jgi:hypothetical protein